jgi:hypothetical protein
MRQPVPRTVALARDLIALAEEDNAPAKLAVAHRAFGYSLMIAGEFGKADEILAQGAAFADDVSDHEFALYGEHPSMVCRAYGAHSRIITGFPTSGVRLAEEAVQYARRGESAHSLAWALGVAAHAFQTQHEAKATLHFAAATIDAARDHHLPQWLALGERCMGWAMHRLGSFAAGLDLQRQGIKRWTDTGAMLHVTHCEVHLVDSFLREGQVAEARTHLDTARGHCTSYGENYLAAEIDRLEGLLLQCEQASPEIVEEYLARSLNTARRQGARLFELRTATAFARTLAGKDERRKALDLLAPVYDWFTEGFDKTDLKQARELLDELRRAVAESAHDHGTSPSRISSASRRNR